MPDYEQAKEAERQAREAEALRREAQQQQIRREMPQQSYNPYANYSTTRDVYPGESAQREAAQNVNRSETPVQPAKAEPKIGRNDPCPCGSGKKYKNCHGRNE